MRGGKQIISGVVEKQSGSSCHDLTTPVHMSQQAQTSNNQNPAEIT